MKTQDTILKFEHVVKEYPGVKALKDVSLEVKRGEIHALVGENGAGKSTLIKVCSGAIRPTKGRIVVDGKEFEYMTPASSAEQGIAVIYQEFNLVEELSVAENVFLGKPIRNGAFIDRKKMEEKTKELFRCGQSALCDPAGYIPSDQCTGRRAAGQAFQEGYSQCFTDFRW